MWIRIRAFLSTTFGVTLIFAALAVGFLRFFADELDSEAYPAIVTDLACLVIFTSGIFIFWRGRQYGSRARVPKMRRISQTVLYLRCFKDDSSTLSVIFRTILGLFFPWIVMNRLLTMEEQLQRAVRPIGELLAVSRPGEKLAPAGAARLPQANVAWQKEVQQQMDASRLVIIRAGLGTGLLWELKQSRIILPPRKLLIFLEIKPRQYEGFRRACSALGLVLPSLQLRSSGILSKIGNYMKISGFIEFSDDWKGSFLPLKMAGFWGEVFYWPYESGFRLALRPVFTRLGIGWEKPRVSRLRILLILAVAAGGGSMVFHHLVRYMVL